MFTAYGILKNNEFILSTVKVEEKDPMSIVNRQMMLWQHHYPDSHLSVIKLSKRADAPNKHGWIEYTG